MQAAQFATTNRFGAIMPRESNWRVIILAFWMLGASNTFTATSGNPFGIFGLRELYLVASVVWVAYGIVRGRIRGYFDYSIVLLTLLFFSISVISSYASFGQPILYGALEDRRFFGLWFFFPIRDAVKGLEFDTSLKVMFFAALTTAVLGFLYSFGIAEGWSEVRGNYDREGRANIGSPFIVLFLCLAWFRWQGFKMSWLKFAGLAVILFYLIWVSQTRQALIALLASVILVYFIDAIRKKRGIFVLSLFSLAVSTLMFAVIAPSLFLSILPDQFQELFSQRYLEESARVRAFSAVMQDLSWGGHGALSLQYDSGFATIYGENFYLSDIGIVGTIHRFGVFALPFVFYTVFLFLFVLRWSLRVRPITYFNALAAGSFSLLLPWLTGAILEFRSEQMAVLLAYGAYLKFAWHRHFGLPEVREASLSAAR